MVKIISAFWIVLVVVLTASTSATSTELPDARCYDIPNYRRFECDPGRCCSIWHYCGDTADYCVGPGCAFQCTDPGDHVTSSIRNVTSGTQLVKVTRYDDRNSLSCANSLTDLSSACLHKYPWASFRVNNITSTCGGCLKLTNVRSGVEAMVRVVHEPATESDQLALELGAATFNKLNGRGEGDHHHDLVVKYSFESCD